MTRIVEVAIVGAGPYGLAAASHLRERGADVRVFGEVLDFWRNKTPAGMLLRSPYHGSDIGDPKSALTLQDYERSAGIRLPFPIPVEHFIDYGEWFQSQAVPDLDPSEVARVEPTRNGFRVITTNGDALEAGRVVVAAGVGTFAWNPPEFAGLGPDLVSHSLDHHDLSVLADREVAVIGGGQSALESAALLHELGAEVEVFVRAPSVVWLGRHSRLKSSRLAPLLYARPDVGPAGVSQLVARPDLYRRLPRRLQNRLSPRAIRPAGARWLRNRLQDVAISTGSTVVRAERQSSRVKLTLRDGRPKVVDHVLLATGYRVDLERYRFLPSEIVDRIVCRDGYPMLSTAFETSLPGVHIIGAPAAWSFGPLMRFVAGSNFAADRLARGITR
ncbi:MAG TPA: NAD(P)-binding domain-containing protein [Acidimicrobiales bacterium]|nr:NAD(P)-binding domain-containing protein [Acidimicrobiales bacterium]